MHVSDGGSGGGGSSAATGTLGLAATDASLDHSLVAEARIQVDRIRIHPEADAEAGFLTIYSGAPLDLDLLDLRNGVTQALVAAEVPAADYRQIRLHVASARLELVNGNVYTTEDDTLQLTSQDTSGFKVFVDPPVTVLAGFSSELLLDFDVTKTFRPIPANDPPNAARYSLHPVVRVANLSESGEIRGVVTQDDGAGGLARVPDAAVFIDSALASDRRLALAEGLARPAGERSLSRPTLAALGEIAAGAPDADARRRAIYALGAAASGPVLAAAAADPDPDVRAAAAWAVRRAAADAPLAAGGPPRRP
ncbi:MAG: DUF4382 domain-containing protein [Planctomycetota bacterium]